MDEDQIRELLGRRESAKLDFKREHHGRDTEFAKDVMAMANVLRSGEHAYILFGIDEDPSDGTGMLVGLNAASPDDADLQQQVRYKLNRAPVFRHEPFEIDGKTIGVLEIIGEGKRPYYPTRDGASGLIRNLPLKRTGSSTDSASPVEVIEWSRQDDPLQHEKAKLELEDLRMAQQPRMIIAMDTKARVRTTGGATAIVENVGRCNITVKSVVIRWKSTMAYVKLGTALADADSGSSTNRGIQTHTIERSQILPPRDRYSATMRLSREELTRGFGDLRGLGRLDFEIIDVTVVAESEYGIATEEKVEVNAEVRW